MYLLNCTWGYDNDRFCWSQIHNLKITNRVHKALYHLNPFGLMSVVVLNGYSIRGQDSSHGCLPIYFKSNLITFIQIDIFLWFQCSVSCGSGFHSRTVICERVNEYQPAEREQVYDMLCNQATRPDASKECQGQPCRIDQFVYRWNSGPLSEVNFLFNFYIFSKVDISFPYHR